MHKRIVQVKDDAPVIFFIFVKEVVMQRMLCLTVCLIGLIPSSLPAVDEIGKLVKDLDGIHVYTRDVPGKAMDEFKRVGIINARLEIVAAVLRGVPAAVEGMEDTISADKINQHEGDDLIALYVTKLPWPLKPRESLLDVKANTDYQHGCAVIDMCGLDDHRLRPVAPSHVPMAYVHASYILEYIDREHTRITYTAMLDQGGIISVLVANLIVVKLPYHTIRALRLMTKKSKYIEVGRNSNDCRIIEHYMELGYLKS